MKTLASLKSLIALDNPFRLLYHKLRAILANLIYGFPSKDMTIIGVTGTNGKTSSSNMIARALKSSGKKVFLFTTVNIIIDEQEFTNTTKMTSPDAFYLQKLLLQAKKAGCEIAVIETASHGIKMHRIWGIDYDISVLTNITQDHLDLHKTMEDYVNTKLQIFQNLITYRRKPGVKKTGIINETSNYAERFLEQTYDSLYTYGGAHSSLRAENILFDIHGIEFDLHFTGGKTHIKTPLLGDFNVQNILAAAGVCVALGLDADRIAESLAAITCIPGRMELVENNFEYKILVDYAHTPDALEKVLQSLKKLSGVNRIITVFGATGDRDKTKRVTMGQIVDKYSDRILLTQDDDYSEDTMEIIKDVLPGINRKQSEDFWVIPDRKQAIRTALVSAEANDIILFAGKGDEHVMMTNMGPVEYHERSFIEEVLAEIESNRIIER